MDAELSADQRSLRELVRDFLAQRADEHAVRAAMEMPEGLDLELWEEFAGLGLCGLAVPERYGGSGCGPTEVALVIRELGRTLAPLPFFSTVALASTVLLHSGDTTACARLLPDLAAGRRRATVALVEPSWDWRPQQVHTEARQHHTEWRLSGAKTFVVDGTTADVILLAAQTPAGVSLFQIDSDATGLTRNALATVDQTRRLARIDLADTPAHLIGTPGAALEIVDRALVSANIYLAAESVGGTEHVLAAAIEYAKNRRQFGRPIGSFQAVKHKCADMHVDFETSRHTVQHAVSSLTTSGAGEAAAAAAICAALCHDTFLRCAAENIQIHGGIGFTWEHHAHLYYKRAQANCVLLGDDVHHRRALAASMGLVDAET